MSKRGSQSFLYSMPKHAKLKLNNNVDINVCEVNGVSTLYLSINSIKTDIIALYIFFGMRKERTCPLDRACENGNENIRHLLLNGANIKLCRMCINLQ